MKTRIKEKLDSVDISVYSHQNFNNSLAMLYHENSKNTTYDSRLQGINIAMFNSPFFHERASNPYKMYSTRQFISFNDYADVNLLPKADVFSTISNRRSIRQYEKYAVSLKEIYCLCHFTYGISAENDIIGLEGHKWRYRNVPSGGALYPLEMYVVTLNSAIKNGLYHFNPIKNGLELIKEGDFYNDISTTVTAEPYIELENSGVVVFFTSVFERFLIKYQERGYRLMMQEVGFTGMNMSLVAEALGLGSCMAGGYLDNSVNEFLGIDSISESIQNVIIIGKPRHNNVSEGNASSGGQG